MNLTKNFTLAEMTKSETALRHDMPNEPGEKEIGNLKLLCEKVLQPVRDHFGKGVKVNSGFRHPDVNAKVGGSRTSDHTRGQAADIEIPGIPNAELADRIKAKQDQEAAEKAFWDNLILWIGGATVVGIGGIVIYVSVMAIVNRGV